MKRKCQECLREFESTKHAKYCPQCGPINRNTRCAKRKDSEYRLMSEQPCLNVYHGRMTQEEIARVVKRR